MSHESDIDRRNGGAQGAANGTARPKAPGEDAVGNSAGRRNGATDSALAAGGTDSRPAVAAAAAAKAATDAAQSADALAAGPTALQPSPGMNSAAETKDDRPDTGSARPIEAKLLNAPGEIRTPGLGLSTKLLLFTIAFVMLAEVLIFVPSVANFRINWLKDRLISAHLAALAADAAKDGKVPDTLRKQLLRTARVGSIAVKRNDQRRMVLRSDMPRQIDMIVDLRRPPSPVGFFADFGKRLGLIWDALAVFSPRNDRVLLVKGSAGENTDGFVEVTLPEAPLKAAMIQYGLNVLLLSVIISIFSAALVYLTLNNLLIRPMTRITHNMLQFSHKPEDTSRIITPSNRSDEIGIAERELAHMQRELSEALNQKNRLAALGLAVSKINHDLRNMLASAQLISDRLGTLPDPTVQRFAPKLIASLDRAITFCTDTLSFGRTQEAAPRRDLFPLKTLLDEVSDSLGLPSENGIGWRAEIDSDLHVDADRDQLYRVLLNLCRNASQALEGQHSDQLGLTATATTQPGDAPRRGPIGEITIKGWRVARMVCIEVSDDGPGVPQRARENLFKAFQGSARKGGTGLGLVIAQELVAAHGGRMELVDTPQGSGATFRLSIPDRWT